MTVSTKLPQFHDTRGISQNAHTKVDKTGEVCRGVVDRQTDRLMCDILWSPSENVPGNTNIPCTPWLDQIGIVGLSKSTF